MQQERINLIEMQPRAYTEGNTELINGEWIFFDLETEEAFPLEVFESREVQILRHNRWKKGILTKNMVVQSDEGTFRICNNDWLKIRKSLLYSFEMWLEELHDDAFYRFLPELNRHGFSIYDLIFCHNHQAFLINFKKQGVNFMIFDNGDEILSVHHHFHYDQEKIDRFEFTFNTGERFLLQSFLPH